MVNFFSLDKKLGREKQSKPFLFDKKFKNQALHLAQVIFNDSVSGDQELSSPVKKRLQRFSLLFFSVTHFPNLIQQNKIYMIRTKALNVLHNWGNIFEMATFYNSITRNRA